tara:strand:- start:603 stop:1163 length:561 start_codon:yes stop_codon:yes gene_type:complete
MSKPAFFYAPTPPATATALPKQRSNYSFYYGVEQCSTSELFDSIAIVQMPPDEKMDASASLFFPLKGIHLTKDGKETEDFKLYVQPSEKLLEAWVELAKGVYGNPDIEIENVMPKEFIINHCVNHTWTTLLTPPYIPNCTNQRWTVGRLLGEDVSLFMSELLRMTRPLGLGILPAQKEYQLYDMGE